MNRKRQQLGLFQARPPADHAWRCNIPGQSYGRSWPTKAILTNTFYNPYSARIGFDYEAKRMYVHLEVTLSTYDPYHRITVHRREYFDGPTQVGMDMVEQWIHDMDLLVDWAPKWAIKHRRRCKREGHNNARYST